MKWTKKNGSKYPISFLDFRTDLDWYENKLDTYTKSYCSIRKQTKQMKHQINKQTKNR